MNSRERKQDVLQYLLNHRENSSAQLLQDLLVVYFTDAKKTGYFVEFGATDGISLSNTYLLEKTLGWQGIVAEPLSTWHERLKKNRTCHIDTRCVYSTSNEIVRFRNTSDHPEYAGIEKCLASDGNKALRQKFSIEEVTTVSLMDLLATYGAPKSIDYLSVDTEGSELEILGAFDFSAYRISIISVEHNFMDDRRIQLKNLLGMNGFVRVFESISRWDDWYLNAKVVRDADFYKG